ncbi:MAG: hypothetical protein HC880_13375, partial [Bacteroidia bacterium]|nr:hypothetical protein [Bacteroidia bacterium]
AQLSNLDGARPGRKVPRRDGFVYPLDTRQRLVFGTYSLKCSSSPQGLYIAEFEQDNQRNIRYIDFVDLANFFNYYNDKRAEKLRKKVEKKRKQGKEVTLYRKLSLPEKFYETDNELIVVIEGYYTSYQNNNFAGRPGNLYPYYYPGFTYNSPYYYYRGNYGFSNLNRGAATNQFSYAIVCAFDKQGRLKWDMS